MSIKTSRHAELRYQGRKVGKCRSFNFDVDRDPLETTGCGDDDRTYIEGLRNRTASAVILYDDEDTATVDLLNSINVNTGPKRIQLLIDKGTARGFDCDALITQVGTPVSVGEATACTVRIQISGPTDGSF